MVNAVRGCSKRDLGFGERFRSACRDSRRARDVVREAVVGGGDDAVDEAAKVLVKCLMAEEVTGHLLMAANVPSGTVAQSIIEDAFSRNYVAADGSVSTVAHEGVVLPNRRAWSR